MFLKLNYSFDTVCHFASHSLKNTALVVHAKEIQLCTMLSNTCDQLLKIIADRIQECVFCVSSQKRNTYSFMQMKINTQTKKSAVARVCKHTDTHTQTVM